MEGEKRTKTKIQIGNDGSTKNKQYRYKKNGKKSMYMQPPDQLSSENIITASR